MIEILIALAVFAVVSSSLLTSASRMLSTTNQLRDKTVAAWIASNEINRLRYNVRTDDVWPAVGRSEAQVHMADIDWLVDIDIRDTENQNVRRVDVDVARDVRGAEMAPVLSVSAFIGRY